MTDSQINALGKILLKLREVPVGTKYKSGKVQTATAYWIAKKHGINPALINNFKNRTGHVGPGQARRVACAIIHEAIEASVAFDEELFAEFLEDERVHADTVA